MVALAFSQEKQTKKYHVMLLLLFFSFPFFLLVLPVTIYLPSSLQ